MSPAEKLLPPSAAHWMGTDNFGRDIFSRVMKGTWTTFSIGLFTVLIGAVCGTVVGALTGYFGGMADVVLMRICDAITAFPSILLALVLIAVIGMGTRGSGLLNILLHMPDIRVRVVCDKYRDRVAKAQDTVETFHDVGVVGNIKLGNDGFAVALYSYLDEAAFGAFELFHCLVVGAYVLAHEKGVVYLDDAVASLDTRFATRS